MMTMLARHIKEGRTNDVRPLFPYDPDEPLDRVLLAPLLEGLFGTLGEAEIGDRVGRVLRQPPHRKIDRLGGDLHLAGAERAEITPAFLAERILTAFAARGADEDRPHAVAQAESGEHGARFVIRMRAGVHECDDGLKRTQSPPKPDHGRLHSLPLYALPVVQMQSPVGADRDAK